MQWYYAGKDGQVGPVSEEEFKSLVNDGTISKMTLVWNSTMSDWMEYGKIGGGSTVPPGVTASSGKAFCSECGKAFSLDEMIRYGNSWVCASCKPVFVQKLKEGVAVSGMMHYAGFWIRFGAIIIDGIILGIVNFLISIPMYILIAASASSDNPSGTYIYSILNYIINFGFGIAYETFFLGKFGATLGKMACKLKVVTADGDKITYLRSFARYFAKWVSSITLCIGYIMAAFDEEKRALHDRICGTRVIRR